MKHPQTVSELYPSKWLKATDLTRPVTVTIKAVSFDQVYDKQAGGYVSKLTVSFERCVKRLIANKTQCEALWHITRSERFADWPGHAVTLAPGKAHNGKPTIVISAPATSKPDPDPGPETEAMPQYMAIPTHQDFIAMSDALNDEQPENYYTQE